MSAPPLLLAGVKVLTLEQVHALPWGTAFLADLGAQVIRIESVDHLQDRKAGPFPNAKAGAEWWNEVQAGIAACNACAAAALKCAAACLEEQDVHRMARCIARAGSRG